MDTAFDGLYALAALDRAPLAMRDLTALGLAAGADGATLAARDRGRDVAVGTRVFLGHLDEPAALAAALGCARDTPPGALLAAAIARYGDDVAAHAYGEWSFAEWDADAATLTLAVSDTARDTLLYTTDGRRAAVAPHVRTLRHLDGVDATPDPYGLLLHLGRAPLRTLIGDRTMLADVREVTAGTRVRISRSGVTVGRRPPLPEPTRWPGSFDEAIEALEAVWRTILREQLARHPHAAVMLSGGLDSSLIAAFAAAERPAHGTLTALTSVAPPGSGIADEAGIARAVADQAGIGMVPVSPPALPDVYRPSPAMLRWLQQPLATPRHYLYDALYAAAVERGADAILDGSGGETTLTGHADRPGWRARLRGRARRGYRLVRPLPHAGETLIDPAFHVRLSAHARDLAATHLPAGRDPAPSAPPGRDDVWGYAPSIVKNLVTNSTTPLPALRTLSPFHDRRLLILFAGMPYRFIEAGGLARAPARALLAGRVPEAVRLRRHGRPFAPDYLVRIRDQAALARTRLPDLATAATEEWLDLAWLDRALGAIAGGADVSLDTIYQVQTTAMAAAFLADWARET